MSGLARPRVLFVDDEPQVLDAFGDALRRNFALTTATSGAEALELLESEGPFVAIVSDMRMPGINGATFLAMAQRQAPDTVRILLTGQADVDTAIAAVNQGRIFRFLTKPCSRETLLQALVAAIQQHRLQTSERLLLEETLHGSMKTLADVLALARPDVFARADRLRRRAHELALQLALPDAWHVELAALLWSVGCLTLPDETAERYTGGEPLDPAESALVARLPQTADRLIRQIPRMEAVSRILDGVDEAPDVDATPIGARILRIVHDYDLLEAAGHPADLALAYMRGRDSGYDEKLLDAFASLRGQRSSSLVVRELPLADVESGMEFVEEVRPPGHGRLIAGSQVVTPALLERIANLPEAVREHRVRVVVGDLI